MNAGWIARQEGFAAQLDVDGRTFQILGVMGNVVGTVCGLFATVPPLDPALQLGGDLREYSAITLLTATVPNTLTIDVQLIEMDTQTNWRVRKRVDNDADFTTDFWVTKVAVVDV